MLLLDLESELIIVLDGDRALGMDHFHPNDRKGSGVINQLEDGLMKLGCKRCKKHLGGYGVVGSVVAVIKLQLWSDFRLHRLEGEASVLLDDVRHASTVHWIGDISNCVQTTILELPPDRVLEGYQVVGRIKLRFETRLAKVVTRLGAELVATLIRRHWRRRFAFTFKVSPTTIQFPSHPSDELGHINLEDVSHGWFSWLEGWSWGLHCRRCRKAWRRGCDSSLSKGSHWCSASRRRG